MGGETSKSFSLSNASCSFVVHCHFLFFLMRSDNGFEISAKLGINLQYHEHVYRNELTCFAVFDLGRFTIASVFSLTAKLIKI